jgi:AcrR family transcriptional regulator
MTQLTRGQWRKKKLREAAIQVIAEVGRDRFTTQDIASRAKVSIGTIYNYWRNRVDVLDDLYPNRTESLGFLETREEDDND